MSAYDDAIFRRLQEARIAGEPVSLSEIKQLGGLYWKDCWRRVRRKHAIGEKLDELGEQWFELAVEPVFTEALSSGEAASLKEVGLSRLRGDQTVDSASVNTTLTLFQPPSVSAIDPMLDEAA